MARRLRYRPVVVRSDRNALPGGRGDDFQCLRGHGATAIRPFLPFLLRQIMWLVVGLLGMFALMKLDYHKLRQPRGGVLRSLRGPNFARRQVFPGQVSRHAPLDQVRSGADSAIGARQARRHSLPRMVSGLKRRAAPGSFCKEDLLHTILPAVAPILICVALIVLQPDLGTSVQSSS